MFFLKYAIIRLIGIFKTYWHISSMATEKRSLNFKEKYLRRLGSQLREARKLANFSQKEICQRLEKQFGLKYTQTMISKMECGTRSVPHLYIEAIAKLTQRNPSWFHLIRDSSR